ncbi:MAG: sensor histidine kinase [Lachnospiraceae bacterium]
MRLILLLSIVILALLIMVGLLITKLVNEQKNLAQINTVLDALLSGNIDRRILAHDGDMTADICYKLNAIAQHYKAKMNQYEKTENANRQLITGFSHDIRTPLTTLIGYLDALQDRVVDGEEREQYIKIAQAKAYDLKEYTDTLFEWFKLYSHEKNFDFEQVDINELTRNIMIEWIPQFDRNSFSYDIIISDAEVLLETDISAYKRIINNLIQNAIQHSGGSYIAVSLKNNPNDILLEVEDNGIGIPAEQQPHIFDRLYKCDESRTTAGSGLGLSIVKELVNILGGNITVESIPHVRTIFHASFPQKNMIRTRSQ